MKMFDKSIDVGTKVRVNNYRGIVLSIITELEGKRFCYNSNSISKIPLMNPLFVIEIDTTKKIEWITNTRQVYIPGTNELNMKTINKLNDKIIMKLFKDEFEVL